MPDKKIRLQKMIAQAGIASRRAAEKLITAGKVSVNGIIITKLGTTVSPDKDRICIEGREIKIQHKKILIALYKPKGVVSTCKDPEGRKTVLDCIPEKFRQGLYPIGRLDRDSEGLILLTNDGDQALKRSHPRYEQRKTYTVVVKNGIDQKAIQLLEKGVMMDGTRTAPCRIKKIPSNKRGTTTLEFTLHEGRNRQIRRMCEMINAPVVYLCRTKIGDITLTPLKSGDYRIIS